MQSFSFKIRHIKGTDNIVADWGSRMYVVHFTDTAPDTQRVDDLDQTSPEYFLSQVHGGRMLHHGARKTWLKLNLLFPGHKIPLQTVQDFIAKCPRCQKDRLHMTGDTTPLRRVLIPAHHRSRIGFDSLTITPVDSDNNGYVIVIVDHKTKHSAIYPAARVDAITSATAIFRYMCSFGLFDEIISDSGTEFINNTVSQLNAWFGLHHTVSLVDVHESNGVERTNGEILRHLRALVQDFRIKTKWSKPYVIALIEFALNDRVNSETGFSAFELKFGTEDAKYFKLPDTLPPSTLNNAYLNTLNEDLSIIRELTHDFQLSLVCERTSSNPDVLLQQQYQPGDFIFYDSLYNDQQRRKEKLDNKYKGPYEVISQVKNDVTCRHLAIGFVTTLRVDRLKIFVGSREDAIQLSMEDADQFTVKRLLAWRGDPEKWTTLEFEVEFDDGDIFWKVWDQDLFACLPYEDFCRLHRELYLLLFSVADAVLEAKVINSLLITEVTPRQTVYVDLRYFDIQGLYLYDSPECTLPNKHHVTYVIPVTYTRWCGTTHKHIDAHIPLWNTTYTFNHLFVYLWGHHLQLLPSMVQITDLIITQHPILSRYKPTSPLRVNPTKILPRKENGKRR